MSDQTPARITIDEFERLAAEQLPLIAQFGIRCERIEAGRVWMRMPCGAGELLRPGGTVNGPAMMTLADVTMYVVVLSLIGPVEAAVTTNLTANFLRRPAPVDMIAEGRILKLGKRLAVGETSLYSEGDDAPVCHVTATYSLPPRGDGA